MPLRGSICLLVLIFTILPACGYVVSYIDNIQANKLYLIQKLYVNRTDGLDVKFCTDQNCANTITPYYYYVNGVSDSFSDVYVYFTSSYSRIYIHSGFNTAFQTQSSLAPYTSTIDEQFFAGDYVELVAYVYLSLTTYTIYFKNEYNQYLNQTTYYVSNQCKLLPPDVSVTCYTWTLAGIRWNSTGVAYKVGDNWYYGYSTNVSRTNTLSIGVGGLDPVQIPYYVNSMVAYAISTNVTPTYIASDDTIPPTIVLQNITYGQQYLTITFNITDAIAVKNYIIKIDGQTVYSEDVYKKSITKTLNFSKNYMLYLSKSIAIVANDLTNNSNNLTQDLEYLVIAIEDNNTQSKSYTNVTLKLNRGTIATYSNISLPFFYPLNQTGEVEITLRDPNGLTITRGKTIESLPAMIEIPYNVGYLYIEFNDATGKYYSGYVQIRDSQRNKIYDERQMVGYSHSVYLDKGKTYTIFVMDYSKQLPINLGYIVWNEAEYLKLMIRETLYEIVKPRYEEGGLAFVSIRPLYDYLMVGDNYLTVSINPKKAVGVLIEVMQNNEIIERITSEVEITSPVNYEIYVEANEGDYILVKVTLATDREQQIILRSYYVPYNTGLYSGLLQTKNMIDAFGTNERGINVAGVVISAIITIAIVVALSTAITFPSRGLGLIGLMVFSVLAIYLGNVPLSILAVVWFASIIIAGARL